MKVQTALQTDRLFRAFNRHSSRALIGACRKKGDGKRGGASLFFTINENKVYSLYKSAAATRQFISSLQRAYTYYFKPLSDFFSFLNLKTN